jgi:hypothetical protein
VTSSRVQHCLRAFAAALAVALAGPARGQVPVAPTGRPTAPQDGANRLQTDGLLTPPSPVPDRPSTSYQNPGRAPAPPTSPDPPDIRPPVGTELPVPTEQPRNYRFGPRYPGQGLNWNSERLPDGTRRFVITGGVILNASPAPGRQAMELAADDLVIWVRGLAIDQIGTGFNVPQDQKVEVEVYLSGNVVVRTQSKPGTAGFQAPITQTIRAGEVYYDVERNRAIALSADMELGIPNVPSGVHVRGKELHRLSREEFEMLQAEVFSSYTPSDPALKMDSSRVTIREREYRTNVFGLQYRDLLTGQKIEQPEYQMTMRNMVVRLADVPVFYWPWFRTDATDPLGPLIGLGLGQDRMFGSQVYTTWDMYKLLALRPPPGHSWKLHLDYLSARGFGYGTDYDYVVPARNAVDELTGEPIVDPVTGEPVKNPWPAGRGMIRAYGIHDKRDEDILGGPRGPEPVPPPPGTRGRFQWRHQQEIMEGLTVQGQFEYVSDKNFLEQYYNNEWNFGPNHETFAYATYQKNQFWASGLVDPRYGRNWIAQTQWLPRLDGAVIGQSFWDRFVYNARANAAYAEARPAEVNPGPVLSTDKYINTARLNLGQDLSVPFDLGPFKLAPYGTLDLTYYSQDLNGNETGRVVGGGGVRGTLPFSRLYEDAYSELFNVRGIYHKAVLGANWYYAKSNVPYTQLPMLDRLNDDAVDQAYRNIRPFEPTFLPGAAGNALANSPIFNPQAYAIRRLVDNRVDTLDSINVLQMDFRQRWQTKRGYPGLEHTVDVVNLDLSASYFPNPQRDNFGQSWAFLEYGFQWHVGDRVSVVSNGWFDPFDNGARYYTLGAYLDRPDRTSFYFGYRQTDPVNSKQVTVSASYQLSRRYYANMAVSYDFGIQAALSNSLTLTRTGSDLTVMIGVTYNALVNNFGVQFLVVPNLVALTSAGRFGSTQLFNRQ